MSLTQVYVCLPRPTSPPPPWVFGERPRNDSTNWDTVDTFDSGISDGRTDLPSFPVLPSYYRPDGLHPYPCLPCQIPVSQKDRPSDISLCTQAKDSIFLEIQPKATMKQIFHRLSFFIKAKRSVLKRSQVRFCVLLQGKRGAQKKSRRPDVTSHILLLL